MAWNSKKFGTHQLSPHTHAHPTHAWGAEEAAQNHALSKHQLGSFRKLGSGVDSNTNKSLSCTHLYIYFSHVYTFRESQTLSLKQPQFPVTHYLVLCNIHLEAANWLIQCATFGVTINIVQFCGIKVRKALCLMHMHEAIGWNKPRSEEFEAWKRDIRSLAQQVLSIRSMI